MTDSVIDSKMILIKDTMAKILGFLLVCFSFFSYELMPYFLWDVYDRGIWGFIHSLHPKIVISVLILIIFCFSLPGKISRSQILLTIWAVLSLALSYIIAGPDIMFSTQWMVIIILAIYLFSSENVKVHTYNCFHTIFPLLLIIPIIVYFLVKIGVNVPVYNLESNEAVKNARGMYYQIYPFTAQWMGRWSKDYYALRFCGVFREPGVVGTFSALLLCAENFKLRWKWQNIVLIIAGIISFSFAVYGSTAIYFLIKLLKMDKKWVIAMLGLAALYVLFINVKIPVAALARFQDRLRFFGGEVVDNRTNEDYEQVFKTLFNGNLLNLLLGNGYGSIETVLSEKLVDGASYKNLIYNYGILGFLGQIAWLFYSTAEFLNKRGSRWSFYCLSLVIVFLANMYQRPSYFGLHFLLILFGAFYKHCTVNTKPEKKHFANFKRGR